MKIIITELQLKKLIMESASLADDPEFQEMVKEWEGSVIDTKTGLHITYDDATGKKVDKGQILVGTLTIGYGTTKDVYPAMSPGEKIGEKKAVDFLKKGIRDNEDIVRDLVKKYDSYPKYVRIALLNAKYRGDLGPDTIELINQGKWGQVSKEYLDHPNYKNPGKYPGVVKRMKSNADAFDKYAKEVKGSGEIKKSEPSSNKETEEQRCKKMQPKELVYHSECDKYFKNDYKMDYGIKFKNFYEVKKGDTLSSIAAKYPDKTITAASIKKLNNLKSDNIEPGQMLKIK